MFSSYEVYMKSQINDYLEVAQAIYYDACAQCTAKVSERDLLTLRSRTSKEGLSFLTILLPSFAADFEKSLRDGRIDSKSFLNFKKFRAIPAFLSGMLSRIFDPETGRIYDVYNLNPPDFVASLIRSVRQICLAFKKIKLSCTPNRVQASLDGFVANERSFSTFPLPKEASVEFSTVSSVLWGNILGDLRLDTFTPRHGPGATADRISVNQKFVLRRWHDRLEPYFPLLDSVYPASCGEFDKSNEELNRVSVVYSDQEQPVKVTPVPKTLKGPRIIAIEPVCMQFVQQAIARAIVSRLETHPSTSGHINFRDQSVNQRLALDSSRDGRLATIDLSDASDRVPVGYALEMFQSNPDLKDAIESCRSTRAKLPNGVVIPVRKFASMGSALCFPVEAMYFYTICVMALLKENCLPVSYRNVYHVSRNVYVYGDDILVPTKHAVAVLNYLTKYNCKVNSKKTFFTGKFRESCGVDAFNGTQVTPAYINQPPPRTRREVRGIVSWCAVARNFYSRGYVRTASILFSRVESILGPLPWVPDTSSALGRNHPWNLDPRKRWNPDTQTLEIKAWVPGPVYRTDQIGGYAALSKSLRKLEDLSDLSAPRDEKHLERSALHGEVALKRRWVPAPLAGELIL